MAASVVAGPQVTKPVLVADVSDDVASHRNPPSLVHTDSATTNVTADDEDEVEDDIEDDATEGESISPEMQERAAKCEDRICRLEGMFLLLAAKLHLANNKKPKKEKDVKVIEAAKAMLNDKEGEELVRKDSGYKSVAKNEAQEGK
ncbi:hypothetical protein SAICODRAFT_8544 [Saitoella complicata NRRL Y-17804]|uniref:uncharacterized protein n=1 Tax=Saitoella complicata (strain BCRC 22490 / CBS 7301 / JCM 7358 / NBRC 10748 / NRRL Y-17804) TaxID=698492 RepID=UPI000866A342|nr:uncharacterized protein SAICODRAFT_8544 [Saitoella complicata NRRL Y-17804]ODQ51960.1 hypothetical protein SAICODRAFT_8544 [Saitoella complicata NRRL Y-17804]